MSFTPDTAVIAAKINAALQNHSDKEWNYSRISLQPRALSNLHSPFVLWVEHLDLKVKEQRAELAQLIKEVDWGGRHSCELGILEIISLRLNKALLDSTTDEFWNSIRPIVRLIKKQELESQAIIGAYWYEIEEVGGEDFDNR